MAKMALGGIGRPDLLPRFAGTNVIEVRSADYGDLGAMGVRTEPGCMFAIRYPSDQEAEAIEALRKWVNE